MAEHPDPVDIHVGQQVRKRRNALSMSQEKLGKALGLTFQQVQKYERGMNRIGSSRLYHLSQILDVEIPYFFEGYEDPQEVVYDAVAEDSAPFEIDQKMHAETQDLVRAYARIKDSGIRRRLLDLIRAVSA
ncbi:MAG: helix-turn-helix transcriptional regulator [Pseudomonadota bacterium]